LKDWNTGRHGYGAWEKMFGYFTYRRDDFMAHYHKRSRASAPAHSPAGIGPKSNRPTDAELDRMLNYLEMLPTEGPEALEDDLEHAPRFGAAAG